MLTLYRHDREIHELPAFISLELSGLQRFP